MDRSIKLDEQAVAAINNKAPQLKKQSYEDIPNLTPLSPEAISRQATLNIGTIGHVAHGKSTVVRAISGVQYLTIYSALYASSRRRYATLPFDSDMQTRRFIVVRLVKHRSASNHSQASQRTPHLVRSVRAN
jgi:hypothetical protein